MFLESSEHKHFEICFTAVGHEGGALTSLKERDDDVKCGRALGPVCLWGHAINIISMFNAGKHVLTVLTSSRRALFKHCI